jgi:hypothetical protein
LDTHGTSSKLGQRNEPVDVSCGAQLLQVRVLTLNDTFHGQYGHGLHALPITVLGEHIGLEVGDEGLEVGEHPLGCSPSTYAACTEIFVSAISKRAMFKYAMMPKTQELNCRLFNTVELPDKEN